MRSEALPSLDSMPTDLNVPCVWNDGIAIATGVLNNPTVLRSSYLIEASTGNLIGSVGQYPLWWYTPDTSLTVGFELAPGYCPGADVYVALGVYEQALQHLDQTRAVVIISETDYETAKKGRPEAAQPASPPSAPVISNYPNPFGANSASGSNATLFRYTLAEEQHVTIAVYDLLGNKVATVIDGVQSVGKHSAPFNGGGLPAGLYIYRMITPTVTTSGKLNLLK